MGAVAVELRGESAKVALEARELLVQAGRLGPETAQLASGGAPQASEAAATQPKPREVVPLFLGGLCLPVVLPGLASATAGEEVQ